MSVAHITTREYSQELYSTRNLEPSGSPGPGRTGPTPQWHSCSGQLVPPLTSCSTSETGLYALPKQHKCHEGSDVGELALEYEYENPVTCLPWGGMGAEVMLSSALCHLR